MFFFRGWSPRIAVTQDTVYGSCLKLMNYQKNYSFKIDQGCLEAKGHSALQITSQKRHQLLNVEITPFFQQLQLKRNSVGIFWAAELQSLFWCSRVYWCLTHYPENLCNKNSMEILMYPLSSSTNINFLHILSTSLRLTWCDTIN